MWNIEFITLLGVIVALVVFIFEIRNGNRIRKQVFFADYTKRFQKIMLLFPESVHIRTMNFTNL
jgi:hypothetical protein